MGVSGGGERGGGAVVSQNVVVGLFGSQSGIRCIPSLSKRAMRYGTKNKGRVMGCEGPVRMKKFGGNIQNGWQKLDLQKRVWGRTAGGQIQTQEKPSIG